MSSKRSGFLSHKNSIGGTHLRRKGSITMTEIDILGGNYLRLALAGTELDHRRKSRSHVDGLLKGGIKISIIDACTQGDLLESLVLSQRRCFIIAVEIYTSLIPLRIAFRTHHDDLLALRLVSRRWRIKCSFFNQFIVQSRPPHSCHSCFIAYNKRHRPVPSSPTDAESHDHLPQAGRYTQVTRTATDPHNNMTLVTGLWLRKILHFMAPTDDELLSCLRACASQEYCIVNK